MDFPKPINETNTRPAIHSIRTYGDVHGGDPPAYVDEEIYTDDGSDDSDSASNASGSTDNTAAVLQQALNRLSKVGRQQNLHISVAMRHVGAKSCKIYKMYKTYCRD